MKIHLSVDDRQALCSTDEPGPELSLSTPLVDCPDCRALLEEAYIRGQARRVCTSAGWFWEELFLAAAVLCFLFVWLLYLYRQSH